MRVLFDDDDALSPNREIEKPYIRALNAEETITIPIREYNMYKTLIDSKKIITDGLVTLSIQSPTAKIFINSYILLDYIETYKYRHDPTPLNLEKLQIVYY